MRSSHANKQGVGWPDLSKGSRRFYQRGPARLVIYSHCLFSSGVRGRQYLQALRLQETLDGWPRAISRPLGRPASGRRALSGRPGILHSIPPVTLFLSTLLCFQMRTVLGPSLLGDLQRVVSFDATVSHVTAQHPVPYAGNDVHGILVTDRTSRRLLDLSILAGAHHRISLR